MISNFERKLRLCIACLIISSIFTFSVYADSNYQSVSIIQAQYVPEAKEIKLEISPVPMDLNETNIDVIMNGDYIAQDNISLKELRKTQMIVFKIQGFKERNELDVIIEGQSTYRGKLSFLKPHSTQSFINLTDQSHKTRFNYFFVVIVLIAILVIYFYWNKRKQHPAAPSYAWLVNEIDNQTYRFKGTLRIGRSKHNNIVINEEYISANHAQIYEKGYKYVIKDLSSTNGVLINGKSLKGEKMLLNSDVLEIGGHKFTFNIGGN
jgi:hypothetical protein